MMNSRLYGELLPIVRKYGLEPVKRALQEIGQSEDGREREGRPRKRPNQDSHLQARKQKATAREYVLRMQLHPGKKAAVTKAAELFERRLFLPTIADIREFWLSYDLSGPTPKARAIAVPSIFSFISTMDKDEIEQLMSCGLFSGPTQLGPISDAIRSTSKENLQDIEAQGSNTLRENTTK